MDLGASRVILARRNPLTAIHVPIIGGYGLRRRQRFPASVKVPVRFEMVLFYRMAIGKRMLRFRSTPVVRQHRVRVVTGFLWVASTVQLTDYMDVPDT